MTTTTRRTSASGVISSSSRMPKSGTITAGELRAKLSVDPEYLARRRKLDEDLARRQAEYIVAEAPLRDALQRAGIVVETVWHLKSDTTSYPAVVPILLEHLQRSYPSRVREGIARAVAVRVARAWWNQLVTLFRDETDKEVKFAIGTALCAAATSDVFDDVVTLLRDRSQGSGRLALLRVVTRSRDVRRDMILDDLAAGPDLGIEIREVLADGGRAGLI
jgi:hypothetical protein